MMNMHFADLMETEQLIIYMNNILITTEDDVDVAKHRKLVHKMLKQLAKLDQYLKLSKCQFEV